MEVVDRLEPGDKLLNRVSNVLGETGVVSGEFGFRRGPFTPQGIDRAIPRRCAPQGPKPMRASGARDLAQHMAWEQRRAARDVAARRREWGEE